LKAGRDVILDESVKNKWQDYWQEAIPYVWKIKKELEEVSHYHNLSKHLLENTELDEDQEKLLSILDSVRDIHKAYNVEEVPQGTKKALDENVFNNFIKEDAVVRSIKGAVSDFKKWAEASGFIKRIDFLEVSLTANSHILEIIVEYPTALREGKFETTNHLSKYLRITNYNRLLNWYITEKGNVPKDKVSDVLTLLRVQRNFEQKERRKPTYEELLKGIRKERAKWSKEKLLEMFVYLEELGGFRDADSGFSEKSRNENDDYEDQEKIIETHCQATAW